VIRITESMLVCLGLLLSNFVPSPERAAMAQEPGVSRWGADDERGAANLLTPAKVLEAVGLVTHGDVYALGRPFEPGMPNLGNRSYEMRTAGHEDPPRGTNQRTSHSEFIEGELGQVGTQFDALSHIGVGDLFFNRFDRRDFASDRGLSRLGAEKAGVFVTRGLLLDISALKGVSRLEPGYEITPDDLREALERQDLEIGVGDAVLIHTGWGSLWMVDNETYRGAKPGLGRAAAEFLATRQISIVGTDTWGPDVIPETDPEDSYPVHQILLAHNGIYIVENLDTASLVRDAVQQFAFICTPLPLKGASGSPVNPIAIR
jgi:kynurenine formamidase